MNVAVRWGGLGIAGTMVVCLLLASSVSADISFCAFGSASGQCKSPAGIAVGQTAGQVYVADSGNNRVNVFGEDGAFLSSFGGSGSAPGQFANPRKIAVDNYPVSPNFQDIYVTDSNQRIQRFSSAGVFEETIGAGQLNRGNPPVGIGSDGKLYVVDSVGTGPEIENRVVKIFSPAGALIGSSTIGNGAFGDAAIDSTADLYINKTGVGGGIEQYELTAPTATQLMLIEGPNSSAIAVDGEDDLYVAQRSGGRPVVTKYSPGGAILKRFGYGEIQFNLQGLAVGETGSLFGSEEFVGNETEGNKVIRIPQPSPGPIPCCVTVSPGNTKATLKGQVNPEGKPATYHFEYLSEADFVANGNSFSGPNPATLTPESAPVGSDFLLHAAEAPIGCTMPADPPQAECLEPETEYHARLVATIADGENISSETTFESQRPLEVKGTWSTDVGLKDAEIHAEVNPLGIPATAFFEYLDDAAFKANGETFAGASKAPAAPVDLGGGEDDVVTSVSLAGLAPDMLYHYRVVVANSFVEEPGPERTFLTYPTRPPIPPCANDVFRIGFSAALANCRAYEMVSPIDKNGGDIKVLVQGLSFPARLDQSARTPATPSPTRRSPPLSIRRARCGARSTLPAAAPMAGQRSRSTSRRNRPTSPTIRSSSSMSSTGIFDSDLSSGWVSQYANPPLDDCAPQGFINLYRRDNATGDYEALVTNPPTQHRLQPRLPDRTPGRLRRRHPRDLPRQRETDRQRLGRQRHQRLPALHAHPRLRRGLRGAAAGQLQTERDGERGACLGGHPGGAGGIPREYSGAGGFGGRQTRILHALAAFHSALAPSTSASTPTSHRPGQRRQMLLSRSPGLHAGDHSATRPVLDRRHRRLARRSTRSGTNSSNSTSTKPWQTSRRKHADRQRRQRRGRRQRGRLAHLLRLRPSRSKGRARRANPTSTSTNRRKREPEKYRLVATLR